VVAQNKVQMSQYRAVGHPIACAVTERLVDLAADRLGLDPFETFLAQGGLLGAQARIVHQVVEPRKAGRERELLEPVI
jgi:CO/xanthine dehydrogenase Mo-binding subunit